LTRISLSCIVPSATAGISKCCPTVWRLPPLMPDTVSSASRPKRVLTASEKLRDASNSAAPLLSSHREAIEANLKRAEEATKQLHAVPSLSSIGSGTDRASTPWSPPRSQSVATDADYNFQSDSESEQQQPHEFFIAFDIETLKLM
jgi:hypothetical protein